MVSKPSPARPRIYIGNLHYDATEADIRDFFDGYSVQKVSIILDRETQRPRGFAFVEMATFEDVDRAIHELDGEFLMNRPLRINEAHERPPKDRPLHNSSRH